MIWKTMKKGVINMMDNERKQQEAREAMTKYAFAAELQRQGFDSIGAQLAAAAMINQSPELMARALQHYRADQVASDIETRYTEEQKRLHKEATEAAEIDNIADEIEAVMGIKVSDRERREVLARAREQQEALRVAEDPAEIERQMNEVLDPFNEYQLDKPLDW